MYYHKYLQDSLLARISSKNYESFKYVRMLASANLLWMLTGKYCENNEHLRICLRFAKFSYLANISSENYECLCM